MVVLEGVTKRYSEFSIENLDLKVEKGEFFTLLGGSGCGKSTLLKIISGIEGDYLGDIEIDRKNIKGKSTFETGLSMVFQDSLLLPNLSVEDNVAFGLKMKGVPKKQRLEKAREALEELGLGGFEKRHPNDLSGGQKQRVAIARALVMKPKVLLMDEPFSALDGELRTKLQKLLKSIQKNHSSTIIFVTHDRDEAFYLSDKIAVMNNGSIVQVDSPKNLYENPRNEFVARFLGINNIYTGKVTGGTMRDDNFSLKIDEKIEENEITIALKAEDMRLVESESSNKENSYFEGIVEDISFKSGFYHFIIVVEGRRVEVVQNRVDFTVDIGDIVKVSYKRKNIIYIGKGQLC